MFACLCSGSRAEGLVVLVADTSFTAPAVGGKIFQALAKHSAFEKLPLARNQQGAVKNLVAKSSEDPDHMGCTLCFRALGDEQDFSHTSCSCVLDQAATRALCVESLLLSWAVRKRWRQLAAKNSRRGRPGKEERGFKKPSVGENGIGSSWDRNNHRQWR